MSSLKRLTLACLLAASAALGTASLHASHAHGASLSPQLSHLADDGTPVPPKI